MRKLLTLGAGAAIVGIILLVIAFAVSYVVVAGLQSDLAASLSGLSASTLSLTYATLEAVFLAVMIVLGYGLITKGLDGVRRQEQMERGEVWAEPLFSQPPQAAAAPTEAKTAPQPAQPRAARPSMIPRPRASPARVVQGSRPVQLLQTRQMQPLSVVTTETKVTNAPPPPPTPVVVVVQAPPQSATSPQANFVEVRDANVAEAEPTGGETATLEEPPRREALPEPAAEVPTMTTPLLEPTRPESDVKWEGGEPEMPAGIEILPEPEQHGVEAPVEQEEPQETATPLEYGVPQETATPFEQEEPQEAVTPLEQEEPRETVAPLEHEEPQEAVTPLEHEEPMEAAAPVVQSEQASEIAPPAPPAPPVQIQATTEAPAPSSDMAIGGETVEKEQARTRRQAKRPRKQSQQSNPG